MAGYNSTGAFSAGICENILIGLRDLSGSGNYPADRRSYLGFTDALKSPINTAGVRIMPVQDGSKVDKTVRIWYPQRFVESQVTAVEDGNCTPEQYPDLSETEFNVGKFASTNFGLSKREVALICAGGNNEMLMMFMNNAFDALNRKINRQLLTTLSTNFGFNYGNTVPGVAAKSVNLLVAATGAPLATGIQTLDQDYYEKNQYAGTPLIVGAGNIRKYFKTIGTGCCNQEGVDMAAYLASSGGMAFFLDTMAEDVLGSNQFFTIAPGMLQFVPFLRYVGENEGPFGTSVDTTVIDPRTGMEYDMKIDYDGCNEKFYVRLTLNYDLWIQPTDTFNPGDPLYRTNGSTRYIGATT